MTMTFEEATRLAAVPLGHVTLEFPNHIQHVMIGPEMALAPSRLHPIFYGSYDWHSCIHSHWSLARLLRLFPDLPQRTEIEGLFERQFTPQNIAGEMAYFDVPGRQGFSRPYGWAWLLALASELGQGNGTAWARWRSNLQPFANLICDLFHAYLNKLTYPIYTGTHFNTAFALFWLIDYADREGARALADLARARARSWFGAYRNAQNWEPGGDEFLSPTLSAAVAMSASLDKTAFEAWFSALLPDLSEQQPGNLLTPAEVSDRSDGKIAHLDGLNLSRAWHWRLLSRALAPDDARAAVMRAAADRHLAAALPHIEADYMGSHWLTSFALLALEAR